MKSFLKGIFLCIVCVTVVMTVGCAGKQVKKSGFIENYPKFEEGKEGVDKRYLKPGVDFSKYSKVMFDHVVFFYSDNAEYKGIRTDQLNELAEYFHQAVAKELGSAYPLVDSPGPDVLRIRTAVTDIEPNQQALSAITTVVPTALAVSLVSKAAGGGHTGVGQASLEAEALDSVSGERVAVVMDTQAGGKIKGFKKWGAAEDAFDFWAKRLRAWLDEVHGKQ